MTQEMTEFIETNSIILHNEYGPSETHVVSCYTVPLHNSISPIPIGRPIDNTQLYILSENKELVSVGVEGELFIGGYNLAAGYYHRPDLTKEAFIDISLDPETSSSKRLYKTGDRARYLSNGLIQYLGRADNQVKIR